RCSRARVCQCAFRRTTRPPPLPTLLPYTTLFRSCAAAPDAGAQPPGCARPAVRHDPRGGGATGGAPRHQTDQGLEETPDRRQEADRKSTRLNSSHVKISYAVFCLKKKKKQKEDCQ